MIEVKTYPDEVVPAILRFCNSSECTLSASKNDSVIEFNKLFEVNLVSRYIECKTDYCARVDVLRIRALLKHNSFWEITVNDATLMFKSDDNTYIVDRCTLNIFKDVIYISIPNLIKFTL